jgi:hypothetical protein
MTNYYPKMTQLARSFPTLDKADGIEPWDPEKLDVWACGRTPSHAGLHAARFVLAVWSGHMGRAQKTTYKVKNVESNMAHFHIETPWHCGPFDAVDALGTWDARHRASFVAWASEPWWP